jgi:hypothetical protein
MSGVRMLEWRAGFNEESKFREIGLASGRSAVTFCAP